MQDGNFSPNPPAPVGTEEGTQLLRHSSVSSRQGDSAGLLLRRVRDDESIEFDYKINIEECAH